MDLEKCRLCLRTYNLAPIFANPTLHKHFSTALALVTGLRIKPDDGLPQKICNNCTTLVNNALKLRKQSHDSEIQLLRLGFRRKCVGKTIKAKKEERVNEREVSQVLQEEAGFKQEITNERELEIEVEFERCSLTELDGLADEFQDWKPDITEENITPEKALTKSPKKQKTQVYLDLVEGNFDRNGPIKCRICKKTLKSWGSFINHAKEHIGFEFMCEFCGKNFRSSAPLRRHCRSLHGAPRDLQCSQCDYLALDGAQLVIHVRREHTGARPHQCVICGNAFRSRAALNQHVELHSDVRDVECEICHGLFKSRRHLCRHKYNVHTSKQFTYKCPVCSQVYRNNKYVRVHMNKVHGCGTDVRPVKIKV